MKRKQSTDSIRVSSLPLTQRSLFAIFTSVVLVGGCEDTVLNTPSSELIVSATRIDFGDLGIKEKSTKYLELSAAPGAAVIVNSIAVDPDNAPFSLNVNRAAIPSGASQLIEITFNPQEVDNFQANLVIQSDADNSDSITVRLFGRGVLSGEEPIRVEPQQVGVREGQTASVAVSLSGIPTSDLVVTVTSTNTNSLTVQPATLTFTAQNWQTPQYVTLTAPQEPNVYNEKVNVNFDTDLWPTVQVLATIDDDDPAVIVVSETRFPLPEGEERELTVNLAFEPQTDLVVDIQSSNLNSLATIPSSLTFTSTNYATPKSIRVVGLQDVNTINENLELTFSSPDADPTVATVFIRDDDEQKLLVNPVSLIIPEGSSDVMTVRLAFQPEQTVTVGLNASSSGVLDLQPPNLVFTPADYDVPKQVTITAIDDLNVTNDAHTLTVFAPTLTDVTTSIIVTDNDTQAIILDRTALNLVEGRVEDVGVSLAFEPSGNVTLTVASSNPLLVDPDPLSFTFTSTNYATPQDIGLRGLEDVDLEDENATVTVSGPGVTDQTIAVTHIDDDQQEIVTSTNSVVITETSSTTISVWLAHQPANPVQVTPISGAQTNLSTQPAFLTFDSSNYNQAQTITLLASDDINATDLVTNLTLTSQGVGNEVVDVLILDDDVQSLVANPTSVSVTEGSSQSLAIRLAYQPPMATVVSISSVDPNRVITSTNTLIFDSSNYDSTQNITISALHDNDLADHSIQLTITSTGMSDLNIPINVSDDDSQAILASPSPLTVDEGTMASLNVQLEYQPSASVTVDVNPSDPALGSILPVALTFTSTNYNIPQSVTLLTQDDSDTENLSGTIDLSATAIPGVSVPVTVVDDDQQSIVVTPTAVTMIEGGSSDFDVRLSFQPLAQIRVFVLSNNPSLASVFPVTLTFDPSNYNVAQTVSISATQDLDLQDDTSSILLTAAGLTDVSLPLTITDDDVQNIIASPAIVNIREGDSRPVNVSLAYIPASDVTVNLQSSNPSLNLSQATLTFTPMNFANPQTVTLSVLDDTNTDNETITVTLSASGLPDQAVSVQVEDDDAQSLVIDQTQLNIDEGASGSLNVRLAYQPSTDFTVSIASSDITLATAGPTTLTFTPSNYLVSQAITVNALDDQDTANESESLILSNPNITDVSVPIQITDDDQQAIIIDRTAVTITEGNAEQVLVSLAFQPATDQRVFITPSAANIANASPSILVFTPANYNTPQALSINALEDSNIVSEQTSLTLSNSNAPDVSVSITVQDNDSQTIIVDRSVLNIAEGASENILVRLGFEPSSNETISVNLGTSGSLASTLNSLTFTAADYATPKPLGLSALQDLNADSETIAVTLSGAGTNSIVTVTTIDDDQQALIVDQTTVNLQEGATAPLNVRLAFQPTSTVTVSLISNDSAIATVNPSSISFTPLNYANPQTVTVIAVEDLDIANDSTTLLLQSAGLSDTSVNVAVSDNDQQSIVATPTSLSINEGSSVNFEVRLAYQPDSGITVAIANSDASATGLSANSLVFTPANYAIPQTVTVSGLADSDTDDESGNLSLNSAGLPDVLVSYSVTDSDRQSIVVNTSALTLTEGDTGTLLVRLAFEPLSDVTVQASISNSAVATINPTTLTFTPGNYQTNQIVSVVTASDNDIADEGAIITLISAGLSDVNISLDITDDDYQTVVLRPQTLSINEGATENVEVTLMYEPLTNVAVNVSSSNNSAASISSNLLTFTPANYATPQIVAVNAVDDPDIDDELEQITFSSAGLNSATATVTIVDDDALNLRLTTNNVNVTEGGASSSFGVSLTQQPGQVITVNLFSSDTGAASVTPSSFQFDDSNWNVPVTVNVLPADDDDTVDENASVTITASTLASRVVNVNVIDDDVQGLVVDRTNVSMSEGDAENIFVRLAFQPVGSFRVQLTSNDPGALTNSVTELIFDNSNYAATQAVTMTSLQDTDLRDENVEVALFGPGNVQERVNVSISDDDSQEIIISPATINVTEGGASSIGVRLAFAPANTTTVSVQVTEPMSLAISTQVLFFTPGNFAASQPVNITALQDLNAEDSSVQVLFNEVSSPQVSADVNITDDDTQEILSDRASITILEGNSAAISLQLAHQPTSDVRVFANVSDPTAATSIPTTVTFTSANYNVPQIVQINGIEDLDNIHESTTLVVSSAGLADLNIPVTVNDNDALLILVDRNQLTVNEGNSQSVGVRLSALPPGNVVVDITASDLNSVGLNTQQLTFSPANYDIPQSVTVTGNEDNNATDEAVIVSLSSNGLPTVNVDVSVRDNDSQTILAAPGSITVNEGGTANLSLSLRYAPVSNVIVNLSSANAAALSFSSDVLTFTAVNYNIPQTVVVTGVDDANLADVSTVISAASSGITSTLIDVTVIDDDSQSLIVSDSALTITEGDFAELRVRLAFQPLSDLSVQVTPADPSAASVPSGLITFTPSNYLVEQIVRIEGAQDADTSNENTTVLLTAPNTNDVTVNVAVIDDDQGSIVAWPSPILVNEGGNTGLSVSLSFQPTANTVVSVATADPSAANTSVTSLTFTPANYATPQDILVTAPDDADTTDDNTSVVLSSPGLPDVNVPVTVADDDSLSLVLSPTRVTLTEDANPVAVEVELSAAPSADTTVTIFSSDTGAATPSQTSLTFTAANWNTPQTVNVESVSDNDTEDEQLQFTFIASGLSARQLPIQVNDDDQQTILLSDTSVTVTEGQTESFQVSLAFDPQATVRVRVNSNDTGAVTTAPTELIFTSANYQTPQPVEVTGVQDLDLVDELIDVSLSLASGPTSIISVSVTDDDAQNIIAAPVNLNVIEGGVDSFTVSLGFAPAGTVDVQLALSNVNAASLDSTLLSFNASNYSIPQLVRVTALQDDNVSDENIIITLSTANTPDATVSLSISDDDEQAFIISETRLVLTEGQSSTVSVNLAFAPSSDLSVALNIADTAAAASNPTTLTFTAANYAQPQVITVSALADLDTLNELTTLSLSSPVVNNAEIAIEITDDDEQSIILAPNALTLTEGDTGPVGVSLAFAPAAVATVTIVSADPSAATISPTTLNFTPGNYNVAQFVQVTAVEDVDTNNESIQILASSTGIVDQVLNLSITDNDEQALVINPTSLSLDEGNPGNVNVQLAYQPNSDVTVIVSTSDPASSQLSSGSLVFTPANYQTAQPITVNALHDNDTLDESLEVRFTSQGLTDGVVSVDIADDDTQTLVINPTSLSINERASVALSVSLGFQPSTNIAVSLVSGDSNIAELGATNLIFTPTNYETPQVVSVLAVEDSDTINNSTSITLSISGLPDVIVPVNVVDDDVLNIRATPANLTLSEGGVDGAINVNLTQQPQNNVTVGIAILDPGAASISRTSMEFTPGNWNVTQSLTVSPLNDDDTQNEATSIQITSPGVTTRTINLTVTDDDVQSVTVNANSISLNEGDTFDLEVSLAFNPVNTTTLTISSSNLNALTATPVSVNFDSTNYNAIQTITLRAEQDDNVFDESPVVTLSSPALPADQQISVNITDDDTQEILVDTNIVTIQEGGSVDVGVRLAFNPVNNASVNIVSNNPSVSIAPASMNFNDSNFSNNQMLTITAEQDLDVLDILAQIQLTSAVADQPTTINVNVNDDDTQSIVLSAANLFFGEGESRDVGIRLAFDPVTPVVLSLDSSDLGALSVGLPTLVFDSSNYNQQRNVQLTALQDMDTRNENINLTVSSTQGISSESVTIDITDDDVQRIIMAPTDISMVEGSTRAFSVRLEYEPTGTIDVNLVPSDLGSATVNAGTIQFDAQNYDQAQLVTINAEQDDDTRDETLALTASSTISANASINIAIDDDDIQELLLDVNSVTIIEGGFAEVQVSLRYNPVNDANVNLSAAAPNAISLDTNTLVFTGANYATPQTVRISALQDTNVEDFTTSVNVNSVVAANSQTVVVNIQDDDEQAIVVDRTSLTVTEGGNANFNVRLAFEPTGTATVTLSNSDPIAASLDLSNLFFNSTNYASAQPVSVSGNEDLNVQDTSTIVTLSSPVAAQTAGVNVTVQDDDEQAILISRTNITMAESSTTTFTVSLAFDPINATTVTIASSDIGAAISDLGTVAFDSFNYDTPQTIQVFSLTDNDTQNENVSLTLSGGGATNNETISVEITDDDTQAIILTATSTNTIDEGDSITFTARLAFDPVSSAAVNITSSDPNAATTNPTTLAFESNNYLTPQTVTINALQDGDASDEFVTMSLSGASAPVAATVSVSIVDDEIQNIILSTNSATIAEEATSSVDVSLQYAPSVDTVVSVASSNTNVLAAGINTLTFTPSNWNLPQTVTFESFNDDDTQDTSAVLVFSSVSINSDALLNVTVTDDDIQSVIVDTTSMSIFEITSGTARVRLAFRPVGSTTVSISSDDPAVATTSPITLVFNENNFSIEQELTVSGVGDLNTTDDSTTIRLQEPESPVQPSINVQVNDVDAIQIVSEEPTPTAGIGSLARSLQPSITRMGTDDIAVVWYDIAPSFGGGNDYDIILRTYGSGVVANPTVLVSDHPNDGSSQRGRVTSGVANDLHIVWQDDGVIDDPGTDDDIIYRRYVNGALDPNYVVISTGVGTDDSTFPDVAVDSTGIVHIVWQDDGDLANDGFPDNDIYYSRGSMNGGFSAPVVVNSDDFSDGDSVRPRIALGTDGCPQVVWQDDGDIVLTDNDGQDDIYFRGSSVDLTGSCEWAPTTLVSTETDFSVTFSPRLTVDPMGFPTTVWVSWHGTGDVLSSGTDHDVFARPMVGTATGTLSLLSDDPNDGASQFVSICLDENTNISVVWQDSGNISSTGTDYDIFERTWNGSSWSAMNAVSDPDANSFNTGISRDNDSFCSNGNRFIVWDDASDYDNDGVSDSDIMYQILR